MNSQTQVIYEWARAATLDGWWTWAIVALVIIALIYGCLWLYRRDVVELSRPIRWTLMTLRLAAVVALIIFFFSPQRRSERTVTRSSEVVVLVDTSQSMALPTTTSGSPVSRSQRIATLLEESPLLDQLGDEHRLSVYSFDEGTEPQLLETRVPQAETSADNTKADGSATTADLVSPLAQFGAACLVLVAVLSFLAFAIGAAGRGTQAGWLIFATAACLLVGVICLGLPYMIHSDRELVTLTGTQTLFPASEPSVSAEADTLDATEDSETPEQQRVSNWPDAVAAQGAQSRIGDSIRAVLAQHDPSTLAGLVLMTDGQSNGGGGTAVALAAARRAGVSVYPVGLGSSDAPINVRVVDIDAPKRVYPGDRFAVAGVLQASGPRAQSVDVELIDGLDVADTDEDSSAFKGEVIDTQRVELKTDGTLTGVRFELEPASVGRRRLAIRVVAPKEDGNEQDNRRDARYEVVARKLRVLAVAGGPTREYRFVRNLLYRDNSIELDVWLQSGQAGMSQDADRILDGFPSSIDDLFQYDAIILFDPDWTAVKAEELDQLDRWLAQQAGGLVLVAGPVYHPRWTRMRTDPRISKISGFYPVVLSNRGPLLGGGRQGGENAWPIDLTPDARRAEFLWVADDAEQSFDVWNDFDGVYDFVGIKGSKPGSKVYGYFSDPTSELSGSQPIYLASQFYGAGRVYFQASGEMWRLRGLSDAYFDSYYTKLIRWVSEGRLLRDSNRGVLLVDNSRAMVGDTIAVRAVLTDEQFEPLQVPRVIAKVLAPNGDIRDLVLRPVEGEGKPGTYGGRFVVRQAGSYELRLTIGDALNEEVLRQSVQVRLPTIELERPIRNDEQLQQIATTTAGEYLPINEDTRDGAIAQQLTQLIQPQPQVTVLPGTPDRDFTRRRNAVLMWLIAAALTMEWVTRRLHRLA
ncbi:MAG: VWA domain-containing protein [Planctomycetota bacterium]